MAEKQLHDLTKLKGLLDSGVLTQEEFDVAKRRILNNEEALFSPRNNTKWIIIGAITVVIVVVFILLSSKKEENPYSGYVSNEIEATPVQDDAAALEEILSRMHEDSFVERFDRFNPWHKMYFQNEWGEPDTDKPYLSAPLHGNSWDISLDYMPPEEDYPYGSFRLYLVDRDGHMTSSYGPVNFLIRGSAGEAKIVTITGTKDGFTFIEDQSTVYALKHYLDQEEFDFQLEFEKYNERHVTRGKWYCDKGFFQHAIETML